MDWTGLVKGMNGKRESSISGSEGDHHSSPLQASCIVPTIVIVQTEGIDMRSDMKTSVELWPLTRSLLIDHDAQVTRNAIEQAAVAIIIKLWANLVSNRSGPAGSVEYIMCCQKV